MSEYIKTCECVAMLGKPDPRCIACNGTGQQLVKPIPEGAVVIEKERLQELIAILVNEYCPSGAVCGTSGDSCDECWRKWLTGDSDGQG